MKKTIHVAVGVVLNNKGEVLIAKRLDHLHQGGLWEFPGGKVEDNETVLAALRRELQEEVAINIDSAEPLLEIYHDYGDKQVLLDVCLSQGFSGQASGLEGQLIEWVAIPDLVNYAFPAANRQIIDTLLEA